MANTRRNLIAARDGQEENENAANVENVGVDGGAGGAGGVGAAANDGIPPPPPVIPPMDAAMANMMPMMQAFFTQMFQRLQLPVAALVQEGDGGNGAQQPPPPPRAPSYIDMMNQMNNLKTAKFSGGCKPMEADEWRSRLERNFISLRCPEDHKKDLAVFFLEGDAYQWWEGVLRRDPTRVHDWDSFKAEFTRKYFPTEARIKLETSFLELRQGGKSVREYEQEFNRLKRYAGREMDDDQRQIERFMRGMKPELMTMMVNRDYQTVAELVEKAALVESGLEEAARQDRSKRSQAVARPRRPDNQVVGVAPLCKTCGKAHRGVCRQGTGVCFKCGNAGHQVRECSEGGGGRCKK